MLELIATAYRTNQRVTKYNAAKMTDSASTSADRLGPDAPPVVLLAETAEKQEVVESEKKKGKRKATGDEDSTPAAKVTYRKLAPPRPFPTVPTSVSATGPRSAHVEGKNYICITRKTPLGAYLRRCKDVILKDGYVRRHVLIIVIN